MRAAVHIIASHIKSEREGEAQGRRKRRSQKPMQKQKPPFHFPFPHRRAKNQEDHFHRAPQLAHHGHQGRRRVALGALHAAEAPPAEVGAVGGRAGLAADCRRAATRNAKPIEVREKETTEHTPTRTHPKGELLGGVNRERLLSVTTAHFGSIDLGGAL